MELNKTIYRAKIIDDERIIVYMHDFNPIKNKSPLISGKKTTKYNEFMKRKHYQRTVKRWCAKLFQYKIDSDKCRFITLTLAKNMA